jgi:hypothetical protein
MRDERELLAASPEDYWQRIVAEVEAAGKGLRFAVLLNHQAAHLLAWATIALLAALTPADGGGLTCGSGAAASPAGHTAPAASGKPVRLRLIAINICQPCLDGEGQECHTPGCALWLHRVDLPIDPNVYTILHEEDSL